MKFALALSLLFFTTSAFAAVVASYHGVLASDVPVKPGEIKAGIRVFHGEAGPAAAPVQVEAFKTEMASAKADCMLAACPGVKHTFTNRKADSYAARFRLPLKYDNEADKDSWMRNWTDI
ncbi:MAG: hypothetical protein QG662_61 [Pseudomonadota bacterium]|nr:hypothetical protein [Pseudomonadota bacterium]